MLRGLLGLVVVAGCASGHPGPKLAVPTPEPGQLRFRAVAAEAIGDVQPIAVAVTNGGSAPLRLDPRQVYASSTPEAEGDARVTPLTPAEAAQAAGGRSAPGAIKGAAVGAATGSALGAVGGAISGAIQGGISGAVGAGAAVGAVLGVVTGAIAGGRAQPDVAGFSDRALQVTTLRSDFSTTGYLYYPAGTYRTLEVLLAEERSGDVRREAVPIEATQ